MTEDQEPQVEVFSEGRSPNDQLAVEVAEALTEAGLIDERHGAELLSKLKSGGVSQEEWGLWVDMATAARSTDEEVEHE